MKPLELTTRYLKRQATVFRFKAQNTPDPDCAAEYWNIANWYEHAAVEAKSKGRAVKEVHNPA